MSTKACCRTGGAPEGAGSRGAEDERKTRRDGRTRRRGGLGEVASGVLLVLMPKCPLCLAGYLSVATGIGISFTTAKYLRILLIVLCVGSLSYFLLRRLLRHVRIG